MKSLWPRGRSRLAACLFPELGYPGVAQTHRVPDRRRPGDPTAGALCQARRRVGAAPLKWLFDLVRGPAPAPVRWRGLLVCAIDGTMFTVADSPANLGVHTKHRGNNGGSGYPQIRPLALLACGTRTLIDAEFGPTSTGEIAYAPRLSRALRPGMIVLLDRGFVAQNLIGTFAATGAEIATATGRSTSVYRLVTTLLDHHRYPAADLVTLYHQRWEIETTADRASFTIALQAARDQLVLAAGVIADTAITLVGTIGTHVLTNLMPDRRLRTRPRVVKRAISKYNAKGTVDRTTYKATISIDIIVPAEP